jgi:hypothetical protein
MERKLPLSFAPPWKKARDNSIKHQRRIYNIVTVVKPARRG